MEGTFTVYMKQTFVVTTTFFTTPTLSTHQPGAGCSCMCTAENIGSNLRAVEGEKMQFSAGLKINFISAGPWPPYEGAIFYIIAATSMFTQKGLQFLKLAL